MQSGFKVSIFVFFLIAFLNVGCQSSTPKNVQDSSSVFFDASIKAKMADQIYAAQDNETLNSVADQIDQHSLKDDLRKAYVREYSKMLYATHDWDRLFGLVHECRLGGLKDLPCTAEVWRLESLALLRLCQTQFAKKQLESPSFTHDPYKDSLKALLEFGEKNLPPPLKNVEDPNGKNKIFTKKWPAIVSKRIPLKLKRVHVQNACEGLQK